MAKTADSQIAGEASAVNLFETIFGQPRCDAREETNLMLVADILTIKGEISTQRSHSAKFVKQNDTGWEKKWQKAAHSVEICEAR